MIKKKSLISIGLLLLAGSANSADFSYTTYSFDGITKYSDMLSTCGSSSDVGSSSVFGASSTYSSSFPILGQFHSEIETMPGITSESQSYAITRLTTAEGYKNNIFGYMTDIDSMVNQNSAYISVTDAIYESTMETYKEALTQIQLESDDTTDMAIDDILDDMSTNYSDPLEEGSSDYEIWSTCVGWWVAGMPYYLTNEEVDNHTVRLNGWSDGELTNSVYEDASMYIDYLNIMEQTFSYDRDSYYEYVTSDDTDDSDSTDDADDTSTDSTDTSNEWWEDSSDSSSDESTENWWD